MRILLTGVAGFIASKVAELLLGDGHAVVGVDNMNEAYDARLKEHRLHALVEFAGDRSAASTDGCIPAVGADDAGFVSSGSFVFYRLDICDRAALDRLWDAEGPFDAVINLAARAGVRPSVEDPWAYIDTNTTGTLNLLEVCRREQVPKFVLASTSSLYGGDNPQPYSETLDTSRPLSPYAASKKGAEALCYTYHYLHGLDISIVRYFTVYGPAGRPDMSLFRFCRWIAEGEPVEVFGDGHQSRDFTYVDDIARGTVLALKPVGYEIINLGSDQPAELLRVVELIEQETGKKADLKFAEAHAADVRATWADVSKARRLLGWESEVTLEEGICRLVTWYYANRELAHSLRL
jgi:UDP-glucuronate 4-epimerase